MRVSDSQILGMLTGNLARTRSRIVTAQQQISSQKRVSTPEQDPVAYGEVIEQRGEQSRTQQWQRNIQFGTQRLELADRTLSQATTALARVRELTIQAGSGTTSPEGRVAIAKEVRELQKHLVQLANSEINGQAIFAGTKTDVAPYVLGAGDNVTYQGNTESQSVAIGEGLTAQVTIPGGEIFSGPTTNVFDGMRDLLAALETNNVPGVQTGLANIDQAMTQLANAQGRIGGLGNGLETTQTWLTQADALLTQTISEHEDADMAKAITELQLQEAALQATQATISRMFDTSLLNFLR
ncbi:MAG: flagellar hook-associated protein FlgL [Nitrospiraceae bacterium]